ncbi:lolT-1 [Coprinopsis cinerea okayama7|uniref:LolT-1 n=1 Tax=Coprinopsis cinerea (strain Okayama-7 / 130 / ATCC MYA-4618 / FGSC 9003) TaxID=240176 RepID=A8NLM5_COPC7|nr:lolT-1 [Coprinopsis cinerea okayama7\|eukprot:XP_001834727.1 lolT-1 [Coprinopsis cinerea okayama7\
MAQNFSYVDEDTASIFNKPPPPFGRALLPYFAIDPTHTNLNSGSYGSTPRIVLDAAQQLTRRIEANPDKFHLLEYKPLLVKTRTQIASMIGAQTDEVVLVMNATLAINTVLRNFNWNEGDLILTCSTSYMAVSSTVQCLAATPPHPRIANLELRFPMSHDEILTKFEAFLKSSQNQVGPRNKRIAIIESIVSTPGVLMPWQGMVKLCREYGVWNLVDAAHSIGHELDLDLGTIQPDFWVSSCHKWLYVKRPCAVLYVPFRNQHIIKTAFPTNSAWLSSPNKKTGVNFVEQFTWNETIDYTQYLTAVNALAFRKWLGGERVINTYCHQLAMEGGKLLAKILGTTVLGCDGDRAVNMTNVRLPFPGDVPWTWDLDRMFKQKMIVDRRIYSVVYNHNGSWWTRCSVQVFNELRDFELLGRAWLEVCSEMIDEIGYSRKSVDVRKRG